MFHNVIFDLDGTLLNTIDDLADAANWVCTVNGWPTFSVEEYKYMVGNGIPMLCQRFSPESARSPGQLAGTVAQFSARYAAHKEDKTCPYPGIPELLQALGCAGVQMAVFSNKAHSLARSIISRYFGSAFRCVYGNMPGVPVKPAPDGLLPILRELGADPAETLFVGDSSVDIRTGHNAGTRTCGVTWGYRPRASLEAAGAEFMADTVAELERGILEGEPCC